MHGEDTRKTRIQAEKHRIRLRQDTHRHRRDKRGRGGGQGAHLEGCRQKTASGQLIQPGGERRVFFYPLDRVRKLDLHRLTRFRDVHLEQRASQKQQQQQQQQQSKNGTI